MTEMKTHWSGFITALGKNSMPFGSNSLPFENTSSKIGVSGFLDLKPTQSKFQPRYDAMSGSWEGVSASETSSHKHITSFMPFSSK
jgi:hypothetical protein